MNKIQAKQFGYEELRQKYRNNAKYITEYSIMCNRNSLNELQKIYNNLDLFFIKKLTQVTSHPIKVLQFISKPLILVFTGNQKEKNASDQNYCLINNFNNVQDQANQGLMIEPFMPSVAAKINFTLGFGQRTERDDKLFEYVLSQENDIAALLQLVPSGQPIRQPVPIFKEFKEEDLEKWRNAYKGKQ